MTFFALGLTACGGGSSGTAGGSDTTPPPPPVVATSKITLLAGNGGGAGNADGTPGRLSDPRSLTINASGELLLTDPANCSIRKVAGSTVSTFLSAKSCSNATSPEDYLANALFAGSASITVDRSGTAYVISPRGILKIAANATIAPSPIPAANITAIAIDQNGALVGINNQTQSIVQIRDNGEQTTIAGGLPSPSSLSLPPPFPDGVGTSAFFAGPRGLAVAADGTIYVADFATIRKIMPGGIVTTLAGSFAASGTVDGAGSAARFAGPSGIAVDASGNVYVLDNYDQTIRKISPSGIVTTLAGTANVYGAVDGLGKAAQFQFVRNLSSGIAVDGNGIVFVADTGNNAVRRISHDGAVTTIAGALPIRSLVDGAGAVARFTKPSALAMDGTGTVFVADTGNAAIRKINAAGDVTTAVGPAGTAGPQDGVGALASVTSPVGLGMDAQANLYMTDEPLHRVRKLSSAGELKTVLTIGLQGRFDLGALSSVAIDRAGSVYAVGLNLNRKIPITGTPAAIDCQAPCNPSAVATDALGNVFFASLGTIKRMSPDGGIVTLAGDPSSERYGTAYGTGAEARFAGPFSPPLALTVDSIGNVFVADTGNHTVRKITPVGVVTTVAGKAGVSGLVTGALPGLLNSPRGVVVDATGNLFVSTENAVVKIAP